MADGFGRDDGGTAKEAAAEIDKLHSVNRQVIACNHLPVIEGMSETLCMGFSPCG